MDLTSAVSGMQQAQVMGQVQIRVAKMILDDQQLQGSAALKLMQSAENGVNMAGAAVVAATTGLGGQVDAYG